MSIVKRNGDGKLKFDWSAVITMVVSAILGGIIAAPGVYYGIRYDLQKQDYRLTHAEKKVDYLDSTVSELKLKDATDTANFINACNTLNDIKRAVGEIRDNQLRLQKKER